MVDADQRRQPRTGLHELALLGRLAHDHRVEGRPHRGPLQIELSPVEPRASGLNVDLCTPELRLAQRQRRVGRPLRDLLPEKLPLAASDLLGPLLDLQLGLGLLHGRLPLS